MLLAFILFGAVLGPLFGTIPFGLAVVLAFVVLVLVRPVALGTVLLRARMSRIGRAFIVWFGPRGLSGLLLALLVVEAGVPGATQLLAVTGVVVLVSVLVHGVTATPAARWYGQRVAQATATPAEEREGDAAGLFRGEATDVPRISPVELQAMLRGPRPPVVLDVRARGQYAQADGQIPGSVRVPPDQVRDWVREWAAQAGPASKDQVVVAYCT
jgi:NhaP-type Na+/H+ or K+/H+ antiporter